MSMQTIIKYLRLCRAQTAPATILLILVPFMNGKYDLLQVFPLGLFALFTHYISFAENSLQDYVAGYDKLDKHKQHHPLLTQEISVHDATLVVHYGLPGLMVIGTLFTLWVSPNPLWALIGLWLWYAWGQCYNFSSKETIWSFIPISICFSSMGAWGWLCSHPEMGTLGWLYIVYVFLTIMFQISVEGNTKELGMKERSNVLVKMGAKLYQWGIIRWCGTCENCKDYDPEPEENWVDCRKYGWKDIPAPHSCPEYELPKDFPKGERFDPGMARWYGVAVKAANLCVGWLILWFLAFSWFSLIIISLFSAIVLVYLWKLTAPRIYDRPRELKAMSTMEIASIFLPIPLFVDPFSAILLMCVGCGYFYGCNKLLWGVASHPKV